MRLSTIWKFALPNADRKSMILMPIGSKLLSVGRDRNGIYSMWMAVDPTMNIIPVELQRVGTGGHLPHVGSYLGTIHNDGEIWHFFTGPGNAIERAGELHYLTSEKS